MQHLPCLRAAVLQQRRAVRLPLRLPLQAGVLLRASYCALPQVCSLPVTERFQRRRPRAADGPGRCVAWRRQRHDLATPISGVGKGGATSRKDDSLSYPTLEEDSDEEDADGTSAAKPSEELDEPQALEETFPAAGAPSDAGNGVGEAEGEWDDDEDGGYEEDDAAFGLDAAQQPSLRDATPIPWEELPYRAQIALRGHHHAVLRALTQILPSGVLERSSVAYLPRRVKRFTVLKSPLGQSKARAQFEVRTHKILLTVGTRSEWKIFRFLQVVRGNLGPVETKIVFMPGAKTRRQKA